MTRTTLRKGLYKKGGSEMGEIPLGINNGKIYENFHKIKASLPGCHVDEKGLFNLDL